MPKIDGARLIADLKRMADFGRYKTGVHRPTFSPQDVESRHWLASRMEEAGLEASIDGIGNVIGRRPGDGPRLLMGSHTDTQPQGGWLDGVMGVLYGVEVARAFRDDPALAGVGVEVASWADEESHYMSFLGSKSFVGELSEADIDATRNRDDGTPLREALARSGFAGRPRAAVDPARYVGYLEAHIEQGGYLESEARRIGVVTSIVGIHGYRVTFTGVQNHAGTTPMPIRKDAGVALVRFCNALYERFAAASGPRSVWTVGRILLEPGAPAIIPGRAEMLLQFRDGEPATMARLEGVLDQLVAETNQSGPCPVAVEVLSRTPPTIMDDRFQQALAAAAEVHAPGNWMAMPSAAGHDAQIIAHRLPAGMMFVPSIGGVSHHYSEDTDEADIVLGCQVFADAAARILEAARR
ncbi:N-carbamoyl-L-amino-acid hydrolase [Stella humosa]|uniref:N-carbamoyl-L-amino-acid hydrolase n=1 Tax=Stella humosa TaxID=94 RepID=A0A3N1MD75_9PROT|nr:Zn-dependent hydrolase [Stella humosa]ROQ01239.1 N-carbamoyl-L-amino-acid hydrolase [Stella humosa]BBK31613.1 Zn-dependent hydrolase [Stella humosa]